jgi:hypothetical protein
MPAALKERVEVLEEQVKQLTALVRVQPKSATGPAATDWQSTLGASAGNADFDEIVRLGADIRRKTP